MSQESDSAPFNVFEADSIPIYNNLDPQVTNIWSGSEEFSQSINFLRGNINFNFNQYQRQKYEQYLKNSESSLNSNERLLQKSAVKERKPIVKLINDYNTNNVSKLINQIFLYNSMKDVNKNNIKLNKPIGIVQDDDKNRYLVYESKTNNPPFLECPIRELNKKNNETLNQSNIHIQCNKLNKSTTKMNTWTKVLQRYPQTLERDTWYVTSEKGTSQAILGPHFIDIVNYGERRILFLGEAHGDIFGQCISQYTIGENGEIKGKSIQPVYNDPYFQSTIIKHIANSTQEVVDVYMEMPPVSEEFNLPKGHRIVIPITQQRLPITSRRNKNIEIENEEKNIRVHGTDIRWYYDKSIKYKKKSPSIHDYLDKMIEYINNYQIEKIAELIKNNDIDNTFQFIFNFVDNYNKKLKNTNIDGLNILINEFIESLINKENNYMYNMLGKELRKLERTNPTEFIKVIHYFYLFYRKYIKIIYNDYTFINKYNKIISFIKKSNNPINTIINKIEYLQDMVKYIIKNDIVSRIIEFYSLFIDTYTLCRILSTFIPKDDKKEKYSMNKSINSIYINGYSHSINLINFFKLFNYLLKNRIDIYDKETIEKYDQMIGYNLFYTSKVNNMRIYKYLTISFKNNRYDKSKYDSVYDLTDMILTIITHIRNNKITKIRDVDKLNNKLNNIITKLETIIQKYNNKRNTNKDTFVQLFIKYAPFIQKYCIELLDILFYSNSNNYNIQSYLNNVIFILMKVKKSLPIPQCQQLTDNTDIKQPLFVRYDQPYLVGIRINTEYNYENNNSGNNTNNSKLTEKLNDILSQLS
jgi:hypothetical protein